MSTLWSAGDGDSQNGGHVQMRRRNEFLNRYLHDGLEGKVIYKESAIVQMRSKNRFSNTCLHDGLQWMVIYKMAAMNR